MVFPRVCAMVFPSSTVVMLCWVSQDHRPAHYIAEYSGTSLIRTSLNRNLANPNGNALVIFFFFFFFAILTSFFLYSDGACPSSTPLAADSTFLTCMNKDVSIHAKLLTSFTHHLASTPWLNLKFGSGTMKSNCR